MSRASPAGWYPQPECVQGKVEAETSIGLS
jgi:hypothetical protein